jgi:predicted PurR-regulated permease PerM
MIASTKHPFSIKATIALLFGLSVLLILFLGKAILVPLVYAVIFAILLNPFVELMTRHKFNRKLAILIAVILTIIVAGSILYLISTQVSLFADAYPKLRHKISMRGLQLVDWISANINIKADDINNWINDKRDGMVNNLDGVIKTTLGTISYILFAMILIPVYITMILYYKPLLAEFIRKLFHVDHHEKVFDVISKSKRIIQSYLIGLMLEMVIIATLNSIGLICLGIDYAIILGIIGAMVNVIPLIGGYLSIIPPLIIAFITKDSAIYALLVIIVYSIIQSIDDHFIIPYIVASRVKINALVSLIVVFIGGALWGIPGMFISIPVTAIVKVIFDNIEGLKPWGFLLGNIVPVKQKRILPLIKKKVI